MPSETTTAFPNWTALQGRVLDGGYEIGECLLSSAASASFKIRVLGDRFTQVVVNVFTPQAAPLEQYALWHEALQLRHPNISPPIRVGRLDWDGDAYPYVLLNKADENLAGVIAERALSASEARELLRSIGAALEHLHANGFVHSSLAPEHVLAMGDSIRLSSTSIRRINTPLDEGEAAAPYKAPESHMENLTVAADIWCLGATLFEVLTRTRCPDDYREQAKSLPVPFDWIVERCLEPAPHDRPTFSEVFAILSGAVHRPEPAAESALFAQAAAASAPVSNAAITAPEIAASAAPPSFSGLVNPPSPAPRTYTRPPDASPRPKLTSAPKPVYTESRIRLPQFPDEKPLESPRAKFVTYAFLAIVLAGGALWLARPKSERPRAIVTPAARTQTATPAPAGTVPAPAAVHAAPTPAGTAAWRVVVFTFDHKEDAEKRARALAQQHSGFNPQVFSATGSGPFLIVLGGPMTREQANRLRLKARASGFPRDSYAQNFTR